MNRTTWLVAFVFLFSCCVVAGDTGSIRCQAGESYVYLYQSPGNFQVIANLKCGQKVELLERPGNGMMRVRASDGKEGRIELGCDRDNANDSTARYERLPRSTALAASRNVATSHSAARLARTNSGRSRKTASDGQ
jgi:hypothetical protein